MWLSQMKTFYGYFKIIHRLSAKTDLKKETHRKKIQDNKKYAVYVNLKLKTALCAM